MLVKNRQKKDLEGKSQTILLISLVLAASLLIQHLDVAVATATEDQYEPDNDHREAHVIRNAQQQQRSIYPIGDQDWLELRIDFETDVIIETYGPTGDTEMWLYQRNVNSPPLGYDNDGGEGLFSKISVHLAYGIYYVKIGESGSDSEISEYDVKATYTEFFQSAYGGSAFDAGEDVQQTVDGGYVIAGTRESYYTDFYLVKTDSSGDMQWERTFGSSLFEQGSSVQQTVDGGYVIAGTRESYYTGDVYLVKTDSNGNMQWDKTFGGTDFDGGGSVQQTFDGGYIIAGFTYSYGAGGDDVYLVKTDSSGNKQWERTFGGTGSDRGQSVQQTVDGGYIIAGSTYSFGAGGRDIYLIKTDSNGNMQWDKTFGGTGPDWCGSVQQTVDGGYVIAGTFYSDDVYLVKTDSSGNKQWERAFGGTGSDRGQSVQQTVDGGYIIAGFTYSYGAGGGDAWLVKTDSNGIWQWDKTFGGTGSDEAGSVQQTVDGGYIIAGSTHSFGAGDCDVYLVKTDSSGDCANAYRDEIIEEGTKFIPEIIYKVLHDPPGDGSYSYLVEGQTQSIETILSVGASSTVGVKAKAKFAGNGIEASDQFTLSASTTVSSAFVVSHETDYYTETIDDPLYLGPGYGDRYIGEAWLFHYRIVDRTYLDGSTERLMEYGPTKETYFGMSAQWMKTHLDEETRNVLFALNPAHDNIISGTEQELATHLTSLFWTGGAPYTTSYEVSGRTKVSLGFSARMSSSVALSCGFDIIPGTEIGGTVEVAFTFDIGITLETSMEQTTRIGYYLFDDEGGDSHQYDIWYDKVFGTYMFTCDRDLTESSNPREYYDNYAPNPPSLSGPFSGTLYATYTFSTSTIDTDGDNVRYEFSWGDGTPNTMTEWKASGAIASASHYWSSWDIFGVKVRAQDELGDWSIWSNPRYIQIYGGGGGGGGCPWVSAWNGNQYVFDNNLIPAAEHSNGTDVVDYYHLQQLAARDEGKYSLLISDTDKHSFLDQAQLLVVDHAADVNIAVSPYGEVLTYRSPTSPIMATSSDGEDLTNILGAADGQYYEGYKDDYVTLDFGDLDTSDGAKLVLRADPLCDLNPCKESIHVLISDATGYWSDVAKFIPRIQWATDIINLSSYLPDANGDLKVRLYFTANHRIDYVGLDTTAQEESEQQYANLATANHSRLGDVKDLFRNSDNLRVELLPGDHVTLQFTAPQLREQKRDFIIILEGHFFKIS